MSDDSSFVKRLSHSKTSAAPANLFDKLSRMLPDPTNIFMNPITLPLIILIIMIMYLSGIGKSFHNSPKMIAGLLGGIFIVFLFVILLKKPSWQRITIDANEFD